MQHMKLTERDLFETGEERQQRKSYAQMQADCAKVGLIIGHRGKGQKPLDRVVFPTAESRDSDKNISASSYLVELLHGASAASRLCWAFPHQTPNSYRIRSTRCLADGLGINRYESIE